VDKLNDGPENIYKNKWSCLW